jgi:hypothetical protein
LRFRLEAKPEATIDLVEPVSTTNGYGPLSPMHTPTVTSIPPGGAFPPDVDAVVLSVTALEAERTEIITGTVATAGCEGGTCRQVILPVKGTVRWLVVAGGAGRELVAEPSGCFAVAASQDTLRLTVAAAIKPIATPRSTPLRTPIRHPSDHERSVDNADHASSVVMRDAIRGAKGPVGAFGSRRTLRAESIVA